MCMPCMQCMELAGTHLMAPASSRPLNREHANADDLSPVSDCFRLTLKAPLSLSTCRQAPGL